MKPSWTQSAASSGSRTVRSATAHIRSLWRLNSWPKAWSSPSTCSRSRSRSLSSASGAPGPPSTSAHRHFVDLGAEALGRLVGSRLRDEDDDLRGRLEVTGRLDRHGALRAGLRADLLGAGAGVAVGRVDRDVLLGREDEGDLLDLRRLVEGQDEAEARLAPVVVAGAVPAGAPAGARVAVEGLAGVLVGLGAVLLVVALAARDRDRRGRRRLVARARGRLRRGAALALRRLAGLGDRDGAAGAARAVVLTDLGDVLDADEEADEHEDPDDGERDARLGAARPLGGVA